MKDDGAAEDEQAGLMKKLTDPSQEETCVSSKTGMHAGDMWVQAILGHIADGGVTVDENGTIQTFNAAADKMFGYRAEEVIGQSVRVLIPDGYQTEHETALLHHARRPGRAKILASGSREVAGQRKDGSVFPMEMAISKIRLDDRRLFIGILRDITERRKNEERLLRLAQYDELTSLPNRHLFREHLVQAMSRAQRNQKLAVLMLLDLDHFKDVNDSLGHSAGDRIIIETAERLKGCLRDCDRIARLGGDEFTVILEDVQQTEDVAIVAQKILDEFSRPILLEGMEFVLTVSIGIIVYPEDEIDGDALIKGADLAMYLAKEQGGNNYQYFSPRLNARAQERVLLKNQLRLALERNELLLHYQPQVDIQTRRIIGAEALIRWQHPELGLVSPAKFIPLAEEMGLIVPIGEWVLKTVCTQIKAWQAQGLPAIKVSVNVSARQLRQIAFAEGVGRILQTSGLDPSYLGLEITEGFLIENIRSSQIILKQLKARGVQIALDDFGTGYSSLSYLKNLSIDVIKMDGSFVRHLADETEDAANSRAIAKAIISLAHDLNLKVIAEGVETEAQRTQLCSKGCDYIQGYLFSRPVPPREIAQLLQQQDIQE